MQDIITIDKFNKLTGQETRHPLICVANLETDCLEQSVTQPCDFYAITYNGSCLKLTNPGEMFYVPAAKERSTAGYTGVLFHPDLLCGTPLEDRIETYLPQSSCHRVLSERECDTIADCIGCIDTELEHAIDRYSSTIIVSQIGLLLNYCVRFCNN